MTEFSENIAGNESSGGSAPAGGPASPAAEAAPAAPAKFLDPETGELRVDALMKSYMALEKRMGAGAHLNRGGGETDSSSADGSGGAGAEDAGGAPGPAETGAETGAEAGPAAEDAAADADSDAASGDPTSGDPESDDSAAGDAVPERPEDYRIEAGHPWLGNDAELNGVLHEHGFTRNQAQLVYDIAHEYVLPLLDRMAGEIAGLRGERQLREVFPGDDWEARAEQTRQWGASALPDDLYGTLAATPAGVAAMHRMMQHGEPAFLNRTGTAAAAADEAELRRLMDDPRYWRDHDPATVAKVQDGFRQLYPD